MAISSKMIIASLALIQSCIAQPWGNQEPQGWLWYKRAPKQKVLETKPKKKEKEGKGQTALTWRDRIKQVRENFDEIQAKAILEPTLENVREFQIAQNAVLDKADDFQKMLMIAALLEANAADQSLSSPASRNIYYEEQAAELEREIKNLTRSFGIFFIFKNDCPYCHKFAPTVKELITTYGFEHKAISKDGLPLKEFPEAVLDNGMIGKLNPEGIYPCLLLVNPRTGEVIPLAKGLINMPQLKENFKAILQYLKSQGAIQ
jgi:conjugal transfer pilus assembly protein TraF